MSTRGVHLLRVSYRGQVYRGEGEVADSVDPPPTLSHHLPFPLPPFHPPSLARSELAQATRAGPSTHTRPLVAYARRGAAPNAPPGPFGGGV